MKNILIVTYYFPPSNNIGALRAASLARHFGNFGLKPTILTRHWTGGEMVWDDYFKDDSRPKSLTEADEYNLVQLPFKKGSDKFARRIGKWGYRAYLLSAAAIGLLQPEANVDAAFGPEGRRLLAETRFDYILVTSPPLSILRLGERLAKSSNVPLVVDLRDPWSSGLLAIGDPNSNRRERLLTILKELHLSRSIRKASLISSVSSPILDEVKRIDPSANTIVVTNGFEEETFRDARPPSRDRFTFSVVGTLYPKQDLSLMIEGLSEFIKGKDPNRIQLNFIGCSVIPEVGEILTQKFTGNGVRITQRIPYSAAIQEMQNSHVLCYPAWKGFRGIASGKIFEYLASKRNILIAPGDGDFIDNLMRETGAGKSANSVNDFVAILNDWFLQWDNHGMVTYRGDDEKINFYSRRNQAQFFAEKILKIDTK